MKSRLFVFLCVSIVLVLQVEHSTRAKLAVSSPSSVDMELDKALYAEVEFFGVLARMPRPALQTVDQVSQLLAKYPENVSLRLALVDKLVEIKDFARAEAEMNKLVETSPSPEMLRKLAEFYHSRAQYADEVRVLKRLIGQVPIEERSSLFAELLQLAQQHSLEVYFDPRETVFTESEFDLFERLIEYLQGNELYDRIPPFLAQYEQKYPQHREYFVRKNFELLKLTDRIDDAEKFLIDHFDVFWSSDLSYEFYEFLSANNRLRAYRLELERSFFNNPADFRLAMRLFHLWYYRVDRYNSMKVIERLESARQSNWTQDELLTLAQLMLAAGRTDKASRYFYTLYITGGLKQGSTQLAEILYRLFVTLADGRYERSILSSGNIGIYEDIARSERTPGALGGILSLILADVNLQREYGKLDRAADLHFNRALAYYLLEAYRKEKPDSTVLPAMYAKMCEVLAETGQEVLLDKLVAEMLSLDARRSPYFASALSKVADVYVKLGQKDKAYSLYEQLLDLLSKRGRPLIRVEKEYADKTSRLLNPSLTYLSLTQFGEVTYEDYNSVQQESAADGASYDSSYAEYIERAYRPTEVNLDLVLATSLGTKVTYQQVFEKYVGVLVANEEPQKVLQFYWSQIKKHPNEEGLYEKFLAWLSEQGLIEEQLEVYNAALRALGQDKSWQARLARWYIRQQRYKEFLEISQQLARLLDEADLQDYLEKVVELNDQESADRELYLRLYTLANERFPANKSFLKGLLKYYRKFGESNPKYRELVFRYYFNGTKQECLEMLARSGEIASYREKARLKVTGDSPTAFAYEKFVADASMWLSDFESAVASYRKLVASYPGNKEYANDLAILLRSLGQRDSKMLEEAIEVKKSLSEIYPADEALKTAIGEIYAELGDFDSARQYWNSLLALGKGDADMYLTVASIYWDYYHYDEALQVIGQLRQQTKQPYLYAFQAGAIYEGKRDYARAVAEYVNALAESSYGSGRDRLQVLAQKSKQLRNLIDSTVESSLKNFQNDSKKFCRLLLNYALLLGEIDIIASASFFRKYVQTSSDVEFLDLARRFFSREGLVEDEVRVLERLVAVSPKGLPRLAYGIYLANAYEQKGLAKQAEAQYESLLAEYPTNYGLIRSAVRFFWRMNERAKVLDLLAKSVDRAVGKFQYELGLELATYQALDSKLAQEEETLRLLYARSPLNEVVYSRLAESLVKQKKLPELKQLEEELIRHATTSIDDEDKLRSTLYSIRNLMLSKYLALGDSEAIVQSYIALLNADPNNDAILGDAFAYAKRHGHLQQLKGYYLRACTESPRNYRWNLILAKIYEQEQDWATAGTEYARALSKEPQRLDLRLAYADCLLQQRRFSEALAELETLSKIARNNQSYLFLAQKVRQLSRQTQVVVAKDFLRSYSTISRSEYYLEQIKAYEKALSQGYITSYLIGNYAKELADKGISLIELYKELWRLRSLTEAALSTSANKEQVRRNLAEIDEAIPDAIAVLRFESARGGEAKQLESLIETSLPSSVTDELTIRREEVLFRLAQRCGIGRIVEMVLLRRLARAPLEKADEYHLALRACADFYFDLGLFERCKELLQREYKRDLYRTKFDYARRLAVLCRYLNDTEGELSALRDYYRSMVGNLVTTDDEYIARYFELLLLNNRSELEALVEQYSPFKLQLIRFLVRRGERDLAYKAIASVSLSEEWQLSRTGEVALLMRDFSDLAAQTFERALGTVRIGQLVAAKGRSGAAKGYNFFAVAYLYGRWLLESGRRGPSREFLLAQIEARPRDASMQAKLARLYLSSSEYGRAVEHFKLALALEPSSPSLKLELGEAYWRMGNKNSAKQIWSEACREAEPKTLVEYFKLMSKFGLAEEAAVAVNERLIKSISSATPIADLVEPIKLIAQTDRDVVSKLADAAAAVSKDRLEQFLTAMLEAELGDRRVLLERLVALTPVVVSDYNPGFRGFLIARNVAFNVYGSEYELAENEYIDLSQGHWETNLPRWLTLRLKLAELLLDKGSAADAFGILNGLEKPYLGREVLPDEVKLLRIRALLATGRKSEAMRAIEHYCGLYQSRRGQLPSIKRAQQAGKLLKSFVSNEAADDLMARVYAGLLANGKLEVAYFVGYVSAELAGGARDRALKAVEMVAEAARNPSKYLLYKLADYFAAIASTEGSYVDSSTFKPQEMLMAAAEMAAKAGRLDLAAEYEKVVAYTASHRLELARLFAVSGDMQAAVRLLIEALAAGNMNSFYRTSALMLLTRFVEMSPSIAKNAVLTQVLAEYPQVDAETAGLIRVIELRIDRWKEALHILEELSEHSIDPLITVLKIDLQRRQGNVPQQLFAQIKSEDPSSHFERGYSLTIEPARWQHIRANLSAGLIEAAFYLADKESIFTNPQELKVRAVKGLEASLSELTAARLEEYEVSLLRLLAEASEKQGYYERALRYEKQLLARLGDEYRQNYEQRASLLEGKVKKTFNYSLDFQPLGMW
ncbi:MAG: tetratricopeptide repeat protein [Acidobacteriota bacterium]|nr:tetratricopeptide repeat protein [Blastocatellia bacterium]MDW8411627.1 tetratricopeptide repeat protein [Acidobacteriota bacterium]